MSTPWYWPIIKPTIGHEAGSGDPYIAMNRNGDGNGLSFGPIQFTQKSSNLGLLLKRAQAASPSAFAATFGSGANTLVATTTSSDAGTRMSLPLWQEPWTSRFVAFGKNPTFRAVIDKVIETDQHMKAALYASEVLGITTERGLALFYDYAVRGPARVYPAADAVDAKFGLDGTEIFPDDEVDDTGVIASTYADILQAFAAEAASHHRRSSRPSDGVWKQVSDGSYHRFSANGAVDIYQTVKARQNAILNSTTITDDPLTLPEA